MPEMQEQFPAIAMTCLPEKAGAIPGYKRLPLCCVADATVPQ